MLCCDVVITLGLVQLVGISQQAMEVKIQKLENIINEAEKNVREKDDRINKLQAQIKVKAATSELTQLKDKLNETEKCLSTALTENQSLQV